MSRRQTSREQRKLAKRAATKREHRDKYADAKSHDRPRRAGGPLDEPGARQ